MDNIKNEIIFNNENFGSITTVIIDNNPWFVGNDVAKALGYTNYRNAVSKHVDNDDKLRTQIEYAGQQRQITIVNESGMYALIFGSKLDTAKEFKHWVTSEVLPQIRKTGGYIPLKEDDDDLVIMAKAMKILKRTLDEKEDLLKQQKPLVDFANTVSESSILVDVGTMAKLLHTENTDFTMGRNKLFAWMRDQEYLMEDNTPYEKYIKQGIFKIAEYETTTKNKTKVSSKTHVTGKGQIFLYQKLAEYFALQSALA